ncbi:MAG: hypothetical protein AB7R69_04450 [Candidatus Babeliales bacterium]
MNIENLKKSFFETLQDETPESIDTTLNALKLELLATRFYKKLKKRFAHIPQLAALADKVHIKQYVTWDEDDIIADSEFVEFCRFDVQGAHETVSCYWNRFSYFYPSREVGPGWESQQYFFGLDGKERFYRYNDYNTFQSYPNREYESPSYNLENWKILAQKLDILDIPSFEVVNFFGSICTMSCNEDSEISSSILTDITSSKYFSDSPIHEMWHGPAGKKSFRELEEE